MSQIHDPNPAVIAITADSLSVIVDVENTETGMVMITLDHWYRYLDRYI
jgi:hypothetical protein